MKNKMKRLIISMIGQANWRKIYRDFETFIYGNKKISYAQEGEDLILERHFNQKKEGFFVDIGAHHPMRFSNTYLFYKKGWRGINVDATPGSMQFFQRKRPHDINLEMGVSESEGEIDFFIFDEPALNSFDKDLSFQRERETEYKIIDVKKVKVRSLSAILDENLPKGKSIDFLSIDVEGLDEIVLKSNNWEKYRPEIVIIELYEWSDNHPSHQYMNSIGYDFYAKTINSIFYINKRR